MLYVLDVIIHSYAKLRPIPTKKWGAEATQAHGISRDVAKGSALRGRGCKAFLPDFQKLYLKFLKRIEYSLFLIRESRIVKTLKIQRSYIGGKRILRVVTIFKPYDRWVLICFDSGV